MLTYERVMYLEATLHDAVICRKLEAERLPFRTVNGIGESQITTVESQRCRTVVD